MGYGSYIADAANLERNIRHQRDTTQKTLAMQKHGIDTSATIAANRLDFDIDQWEPEEERRKWSQTQLQERVEAGENVSNLIAENLQEEGLVSKKIDEVGQYRWEDKPNMWDMLSGKRTYSDWATGVGGRVVDWAGFGISDEDVVGDPQYGQLTPEMVKNIDPDELIQILKSKGLFDPGDTPNRSTKSLLGLSNPNPGNWQTNIENTQERGW